MRRTIDAFEAAQGANGKRDSRHRIEHVEVIHPDDLPRLAELGIVASLQPGHAPRGHIFPPDGVGQYLHDDQIAGAYAWQTIRDSGAKVVFSTDWPVIPVDVMASLKAAVFPRDMGAKWPDQRQSLQDTLASYTRDNAWVSFDEDTRGKLAAGMAADIAVMSHDLSSLTADTILNACAMTTIMDGVVTFQREG